MAKSLETLNAVKLRLDDFEHEKGRLEQEARLWVEERIRPALVTFEQSVSDAVNDGHTVTDVARVITGLGKTPNRNRVYEILSRTAANLDAWTREYPFEWQPREVQTAKGVRTVMDVTGVLEDFGPDEINGAFQWRYDRSTGELELVEYSTAEPYPTTRFYRRALQQWLQAHPYPEGDM